MIYFSEHPSLLIPLKKALVRFSERYDLQRDVWVDFLDLESENCFGFCSDNGEGEHEIQIHRSLEEGDAIVTFLHELVHCHQNEIGMTGEDEREEQAEEEAQKMFSEMITNSHD